ncbi:MAG: hypothetical protein DRP72_04500, partial [Candidatus Omnitrophota bacterium]
TDYVLEVLEGESQPLHQETIKSKLNQLSQLIKGYKVTAPPERFNFAITIELTHSNPVLSTFTERKRINRLVERNIKDGGDILLQTQIDKEKIIITQDDLEEIKAKLPKVLKEYDIRGPDEIITDKKLLILLGLALGNIEIESHWGKEKLNEGDYFLVAGDNGPTTFLIAKYLIEGLRLAGINVIYLGCLRSGLLYSSIPYLNACGGLYITRSHVEVGTNGFKPVIGRTTLYAEMIQKLGQIIEKGEFRIAGKKGKLIGDIVYKVKDIDRKIRLQETEKLLTLLEKYPLKIAIDFGGGSATTDIELVREILGNYLVKLFRTEFDPYCIRGLPDPSRSDEVCLNHPQARIIEWSKSNREVIIFSFDLDVDRCAIIWEGTLYKGDLLFYPVIEYLLTIYKYKDYHKEFYYDARMSPSIVELINHFGGIAKIHPKGHSKVKRTQEEFLIKLATNLGYKSVEEFVRETGYTNYQIEYSLHPFVTTESGRSVDDALRFMFLWLYIFLKIREKYNNPNLTLKDYINSLKERKIISAWYTLSEQRTPMQEEYKKEIMNQMKDEIVKFFKDNPQFEHIFWKDFTKQTNSFTLIDIEGVYYFITPLGIFYWGWSNTSSKISFGAHSKNENDLLKLTEIMLSLYINIREKKPNLEKTSQTIQETETLALRELFKLNTNEEIEESIKRNYPQINLALKSLYNSYSEREDGGKELSLNISSLKQIASFLREGRLSEGNIQPEVSLPLAKWYEEIATDKGNSRLGFVLDVSESDLEKYFSKIKPYLKDKKAFIFVGMGGSINTVKIMRKFSQDERIIFIDTPDKMMIKGLVEELQGKGISLEEIGVIAISKSATTFETHTIVNILKEIYTQNKLDFTQNLIWLIDLPN